MQTAPFRARRETVSASHFLVRIPTVHLSKMSTRPLGRRRLPGQLVGGESNRTPDPVKARFGRFLEKYHKSL